MKCESLWSMISFSCNDDPKLTRGFYFHQGGFEIAKFRINEFTIQQLPTYLLGPPQQKPIGQRKHIKMWIVLFFCYPFNFRAYDDEPCKTSGFTLPEANSSHLKMDGWNPNFLLGPGLFSGAFAVSFRECMMYISPM